MKSIKIKLLVAILLILSIFIGGIVTYGVTFKGYYKNQKFKEINKIINKVLTDVDSSGINRISSSLEIIATEYNLQIEIVDNLTNKIVFTTSKIGKNNAGGMGGQHRFEDIKTYSINNGVTNSLVHDKGTGLDFLSSNKVSNDGESTLFIRSSISEIADAASKSMELLTIILLPIIIIAILATILFSNAFTKPIIAITKKTKKIEELDFNYTLNINVKDEIGNLAASVNNLSNKIKTTLEDLQDKNSSLEKYIQKEKENEIIRREFVSSVSHELKSPIAVISGYVQALQSGMLSTNEDKEYYLGVINEETERMQVIVNDLLDLYKLESNTFKLDIKEVDLGALVKKIIRKNSLQFAEANITVKSVISECIVMGDEIRLEQAIQNYINNAVSHVDERKILEINVSASGAVTVFNSGQNIEEKNLEKIWQGFVRVDKVRNYKEKRVGLGLAIVKQIVKLHGGDCGVSNKENGVEFWFKVL